MFGLDSTYIYVIITITNIELLLLLFNRNKTNLPHIRVPHVYSIFLFPFTLFYFSLVSNHENNKRRPNKLGLTETKSRYAKTEPSFSLIEASAHSNELDKT